MKTKIILWTFWTASASFYIWETNRDGKIIVDPWTGIFLLASIPYYIYTFIFAWNIWKSCYNNRNKKVSEEDQ